MNRLLRMRRGEQVELQSGTGLDPVWRKISELSPAFGIAGRPGLPG